MNAKILPFVAAALIAGDVSCFYDSRWGEVQRAQRHNAQALAPAEPSRPREGGPPASVRTVSVRVLATKKYVAQTVDWQRDGRAWIADASSVLESSLGLRLRVVEMGDWPLPPEQEELEPALAALQSAHPSSTADGGWTVGLIGGLPRYTLSFHRLGMAPLHGTSFVLRAGTDLQEHDAIERGLDEIPLDERLELVRKRRRHRAVAVFLHELGHTLGAVHHQDERGWMFPEYRSKMDDYGPVVTELLRTSLRHRDRLEDPAGVTAWATEMLQRYRGPAAETWVAPERDARIQWLSTVLASNADRMPASSASQIAPGPNLAGVSDADRSRYLQARDLLQADRPAEAGQALEPLVKRYPDVLDIHDLRCQIAMRSGLSMAGVRAECARLMELSRATGK